MKPLNRRQIAFLDEYIANGYNGVQAYLKIYTTCHNYGGASCNCYNILQREDAKEYIKQRQKEAFEAAAITPERVALKLAEIGFASKGDENYPVSAQLKALDLIQKQMGLQTQKVDTNIKTVITVDIEDDQGD